MKTLIDSSDKKVLNQVDEEGRTGLHFACQRGRLDVVQYLVDQMDNNQMNINVTNNDGNNALYWAIQHEEIAKVLLQTGKLDIKNMQEVSDFVKNSDGSIVFKICGLRNFYVIKMDSHKVVNSIKELKDTSDSDSIENLSVTMGANSSHNENPNETIPAFEPRFEFFFNILLITRFNNQF